MYVVTILADSVWPFNAVAGVLTTLGIGNYTLYPKFGWAYIFIHVAFAALLYTVKLPYTIAKSY